MYDDIKPDYHLKEKRKCLGAITVGLLFTVQAGRILTDFPFNEVWKNILAIIGGLGFLLISGIGYWKYRKLTLITKEIIHKN